MFRYASSALLILLVLAGLTALIPPPQTQIKKGVELLGVDMRLYPRTEKPGVVWLFAADKIVNRPEDGESVLSGMKLGKRMINGTLDMTLQADHLTIDSQDNLYTDQVVMSIPKECTTLSFGEPGQNKAVVIDQNSGFSGPNVKYRDAYAVLTAKSIRSDFELHNASMPGQKLTIALDPKNECVNGRIVKRIPKGDKK
jgi:hypothetical protein